MGYLAYGGDNDCHGVRHADHRQTAQRRSRTRSRLPRHNQRSIINSRVDLGASGSKRTGIGPPSLTMGSVSGVPSSEALSRMPYPGIPASTPSEIVRFRSALCFTLPRLQVVAVPFPPFPLGGCRHRCEWTGARSM